MALSIFAAAPALAQSAPSDPDATVAPAIQRLPDVTVAEQPEANPGPLYDIECFDGGIRFFAETDISIVGLVMDGMTLLQKGDQKILLSMSSGACVMRLSKTNELADR
jgi:hypothetical protein